MIGQTGRNKLHSLHGNRQSNRHIDRQVCRLSLIKKIGRFKRAYSNNNGNLKLRKKTK